MDVNTTHFKLTVNFFFDEKTTFQKEIAMLLFFHYKIFIVHCLNKYFNQFSDIECFLKQINLCSIDQYFDM